MFPAPTTIATSTPRSRIVDTWAASRCTSWASVPYSSFPISASPESFRRMRPNLGSGVPMEATLFPYAEIGKARDADVLAGLRRQLLAQLLDRLRLVLLGVDVRLVEQRHLARPLGKLALDDFLDHVVRLAFLARLLLEDLALRLSLLLWDLLRGDVARR